MRPIKKGTTDVSIVIRIIDSSDGTPETGVEHDTSGIDLWYRREGATKTSITEAVLGSLDASHSDGGIEHIGDGYYRLDLPDAAVASGVNGVMVGGAVTGMIVIGCYIPLVDYDPYDSVRMGMTALPNAAADAAGGLPISDAGGLDLDAQIGTDIDSLITDMAKVPKSDGTVSWNATALGAINSECDTALSDYGANTTTPPTASEIQAELEENGASILDTLRDDLADGGRLDLLIDAIKDKTDNLPADPADDSDIDAQLATIAGYLDTEVAAIKAVTDNLPDSGALTTLDGKIDTIDTVVDGIQTDLDNGTDGLGALKALIDALNNISADDVWDATSATLSLSFEALMDRVYQMTSNKMAVNESTGAVALRNIGDTADIATGSVTSSSGTTTRAGLSWV